MDVYVDVLLLLNGYVNYFLLRAAARLLHRSLRTLRCAGSALIGSLSALAIFLPALPLPALLLIRLCVAWCMILLAFGRRDSLRALGALLLVSAGFGGGLLAVLLLLRPQGFAVHNGSLYVEFSPLMLVVFTAAAYAVTCLVRRCLDSSGRSSGRYRVLIRAGARVISLEGLADTGNALVDGFTGRAVIVCGRRRLAALSSACAQENATAETLCTSLAERLRGVRLLPFSTVAAGGVMPVFRPDEVVICEESTHRRKQVDALIGVGEADTAAIFNPKLLL